MPDIQNRRFQAAFARCPPMLGPACAAAAGSGLAWRVADSRLGNQVSLVPLVLVSLFVVVLLIFRLVISPGQRYRLKNQQASDLLRPVLEEQQASFFRFVILLVCVCFCLTFWQTKALLAGGKAAQERLSGRIARESGKVIKLVTAADPDFGNDWGRVDVRLSDGSVVQLSGEVGRLLPGQTISFQARFSVPSAQRNPGGFDEKMYLARSGIFLKADLFLNRLEVTDKSTNILSVGALRARAALTKAALMLMPAEEAGLLLGVLTGDTARMSKQDKAAFQAAGISHLTAVSGANVAFLLAPMTYLLLKVLRRRNLRILGLLIFVLGFGFLTAWEASVTRAIIMVILTLVGKLGRRRSDPLNALLFAATFMLLSKPLLILSFSFQLSFLATAGILLASERMSARLQRWIPLLPAGIRVLLSLNLSVQLTVLPLQLLVTGIFSPLSIVANLPALPLAEGISLLGACVLLPTLLLLPMAAKISAIAVCLRILAWPVRWLLQALIRLATVFAAPGWPRVLTSQLPQLYLAALAIALTSLIIVSFHWRRRMQRLACLLLLAAMILQLQTSVTRPDLTIWMFDVGQGDAMLLQARDGTTTLIDTGTEAAGKADLQPALQALGIRKLSQVIITHGHADHAGGLKSLLTPVKIDRIVVPQISLDQLTNSDNELQKNSNGLEKDVLAALLPLAGAAGLQVQGTEKGDTIPLGSGAKLLVLAPAEPLSSDAAILELNRRGSNAHSLIMRLTAADGSFSLLLTADCDRESEQELVRSGQNLKANILKVAHHGSNATTEMSLLSAVEPELALISVGRNDYGHPAPAMLERLEQRDIGLARTDQCGAVVVKIYSDHTSVSTWLSNPGSATK